MRFFCCCAVLLIAAFVSGCGGTDPEPDKTAREPETLVWYLPTAGSYIAASEVSSAVNDRVHAVYPNINIDFRFINIYEYHEKISVYLAAGEQADIVWASDDVLPYINYPSDSIYKFLDAPIRTGAPAVRARLELDDPSLYRIYDKNYFIPMTPHSSGLIPFLKIPEELLPLMDTDALLGAVNGGGHADSGLFDVINEYLARAASAGELRDGIEFAEISRIFPEIGYETFISSSGLIGAALDDPSLTAVDMLSEPSSKLSYETYGEWSKKGYIKENTPIIYKSEFDSEYSYIMSGAWGYKTENGWSMVMDKNTGGFVYIALDCRPHPTRQFASSAAILPADGEHSESAVKIINLFYSDPALYDLVSFGLEGTHYERTADGRAKRISDEYRAFENIVPRAEGALSSVSADCVYAPELRAPESYPGMAIPSSSKEFRRMLFEYTDSHSVPPYSLSLPQGGGAEISGLLDIYNGVTVLD